MVLIFIVLTVLKEEREIGEIQRQFVVIWIFFREICIGYFCHVVTHLPKSGDKIRWSVYTVLFKWWQICESWMFRFHPFGTSFRARCIAYVSWIQRLSLTFSYVSLEASPKLFHRRSTIKCTWTLFMNFYLWAHYTCTFNSW